MEVKQDEHGPAQRNFSNTIELSGLRLTDALNQAPNPAVGVTRASGGDPGKRVPVLAFGG